MTDLIELAAHHLAEEKRYLEIHVEDEETLSLTGSISSGSSA